MSQLCHVLATLMVVCVVSAEITTTDQYTACLNYPKCAELYLLPSAIDQFERLAVRAPLDPDLEILGGPQPLVDRAIALILVAGALESPLCMPFQTIKRHPDGTVECICREDNDCEMRYCQTNSLAWLMGITDMLILGAVALYAYSAIKNKRN